MGSSRWSPEDWGTYSKDTSSKKAAEIFTSAEMKDEYNPKLIQVRESRDSAVNPESTAIIITSDVTGSMGRLAEDLIRKGIGVVFEEILSRKPVTDPHLMVMATGDLECDRAPLQCTQFEADITIAKQLEEVFIERGGGGNSGESYNAAWWFAANKTEIDCFEKRGKKGYLFTVGDEPILPEVTSDQITRFLGTGGETTSNRDLLTLVSRKYEVFHVMVPGHWRGGSDERVVTQWLDLLGERVIRLQDPSKLAEVIVSAIEINEGKDHDAVLSSWSGDTSIAVANAVGGMSKGTGAPTAVVRL